MKILHIITDTNIGGAGTHLLALVDFADRDFFNIEVALPADSKLMAELETRNVPYTAFSSIADRSFSFAAVHDLTHFILKKKPDIVHTHASFSGRIAAWICRRKVVHTRHSVFEPPPVTTRFPIKQIMGTLNNIFSSKIIAVSPAAAENLIKQGTDSKKITMIYNGVPQIKTSTDEEKAAIRKQYGVPYGAFVVLHMARLEDIKGQNYTLDAAKILIGDPNIFIIIAGGGTAEAALKKRIADENITNVSMAGFVRKVDELLNITDLQINASYGTEATSLSLIEGMSIGVPAAVSDFGGNPYVVTDEKNGLIFPQKNSAALAEAIMKIKNDNELRKRLSDGAREEYNKRFKAEDMVKKTEEIYRGLKQ